MVISRVTTQKLQTKYNMRKKGTIKKKNLGLIKERREREKKPLNIKEVAQNNKVDFKLKISMIISHKRSK